MKMKCLFVMRVGKREKKSESLPGLKPHSNQRAMERLLMSTRSLLTHVILHEDEMFVFHECGAKKKSESPTG